jgi:bifunctional non-homologous end joining protein LigD
MLKEKTMRYRKIEGGEKLSSFIKPMLAQLTDQPAFDDPEWLFEIKWDGYRAIAEVKKGAVRLYSRNGLSFAKAYSKVYDALKKLKMDIILDGEIVVFDNDKKPSFQKLQNYSNNSSYTIHYFVFDCLSMGGKDITGLPLIERKAILKSTLPKDSVIRYCDHIEESGKAFFKELSKTEMEGMIAKRAASRYQMGKRNSDWLKIKNVKSDEAVIVGFTRPKGSRIGFGSLLLAQYENKKLKYIGNVGTGFTDDILKSLYKKLNLMVVPTSPLDFPIKPPADTSWVKPNLVCNLKFTEKTSDGMIRHPVFLGLRIDKAPREVVPEKPTGKVPRKSGRLRKSTT